MNIEDMRALTAYDLARYVDCASPDAPDSAGARLLISVRDSVVEIWERDGSVDDSDAHMIADDAPAVYTHTRWTEFVDLAAYSEDPELGEWPSSLTEAASVALYQIARRLVDALIEEMDGE